MTGRVRFVNTPTERSANLSDLIFDSYRHFTEQPREARLAIEPREAAAWPRRT